MKYLAALTMLALPTVALADEAALCQITASADAGDLQKGYDPFSPQSAVWVLQLNATNASEQSCEARFYVGPIDGRSQLRGPAQELTYYIDAPAGGKGGGETGPFPISLPPGGSRSAPVRIIVPPQQMASPGAYSGQLSIRGESRDKAQIDVAGANPIMSLVVEPRAALSISGGAASIASTTSFGGASMIFPDAKKGQSDRVFVNVWANSLVTITLESENGGQLKNTENPTLRTIPYSATFDGTELPMTGLYTVSRTPTMSLQGSSYELRVTLGDTEGRFAGTYKDTISVNIIEN